MTPGLYIRLRREAAGLSIGDVMAVLGKAMLSAPLAEIEAGLAMPTGMDAALLAWAFEIDDMLIAAMKDGEAVRVCQSCGCSEGRECEEEAPPPAFGRSPSPGNPGAERRRLCWLPAGDTLPSVCSGCAVATMERAA